MLCRFSSLRVAIDVCSGSFSSIDDCSGSFSFSRPRNSMIKDSSFKTARLRQSRQHCNNNCATVARYTIYRYQAANGVNPQTFKKQNILASKHNNMLNSSNLRNQQRGYGCTDVCGRTTTTSAIHVVGNDATIDVSIDLDQRVLRIHVQSCLFTMYTQKH